ncbi:divalent-cation tolerance protein CutA [Streptomyces sp. NPDC048623]|uniref:divalent-cation tolerance protein CutA n=1 Tax=Streptomyces sp. NPDC048623 TaxID=3155761 RepID=UPI00341E8EE3
MPTEIVIAQTTVDDVDMAIALARGAVESRLAAGTHIDGPFIATYRWRGGIQTEQEWRISYKTTVERLPALQAWVHQHHRYEAPEWITLPVTGGSSAYLSWVTEETTPDSV